MVACGGAELIHIQPMSASRARICCSNQISEEGTISYPRRHAYLSVSLLSRPRGQPSDAVAQTPPIKQNGGRELDWMVSYVLGRDNSRIGYPLRRDSRLGSNHLPWAMIGVPYSVGRTRLEPSCEHKGNHRRFGTVDGGRGLCATRQGKSAVV